MTKENDARLHGDDNAHILGCIEGMYLDSKAFEKLKKRYNWTESEYSYWLGHNHALEKIKDAILND